jgi:microcystin-dependent protein
MQFHAADQWRVVTGGAERLEVNNTQVTSAEPVHAPSFHGDGSALTGIEGVPTGVIVMWSGQTSAIPSGWVLCDGNNSTPNLTDRFVMGAGASNETTTGGANTRTLATGNIPSHTHSFSGTTNTTGSHAHTGSTASAGAHTHTISSIGSLAYPQNSGNQGNQSGYGRGSTLTTNSAGAHTHTLTINANGNHSHTISGTTGSTGSTSGFDNRPAYMALAYIMKT